MRSSNLGAEEKFLQSKILTEKIENRNGYLKEKNLMESINAKLLILKEINDWSIWLINEFL